MNYTLIATLGLSPGAVTGLYDALACDMQIFPDRVHLLMTNAVDVKRSAWAVEEAFKDRYATALPTVSRRVFEDATDMDLSRRLSVAFQKMVLAEIGDCLEEDRQLIIGITGGRVSMGTMLATGAHLYSEWVQGMYHMWVAPSVEKSGGIDNLDELKRARLFDRRNEILFPLEHQRRAVWLPVYNLGLQRQLVEQHTTMELRDNPDINPEMANQILHALPGRISIPAGNQYGRILGEIAKGADPRAYVEETAAIFYEAGGLPMASGHIEYLFQLAERQMAFEETMRQFAARAQDESRVQWFRPLDWLKSRQGDMEAITAALEMTKAGMDVASHRLVLGGLLLLDQYFQIGLSDTILPSLLL